MPFFDVGSLAPFKPSNLQGLKLSNFKLSSFDNFEFEEPRSGHQAQASTSKRAACERALFNALDAEQSFFSCASRRRWERQSASGTLRSTAELYVATGLFFTPYPSVPVTRLHVQLHRLQGLWRRARNRTVGAVVQLGAAGLSRARGLLRARNLRPLRLLLLGVWAAPRT